MKRLLPAAAFLQITALLLFSCASAPQPVLTQKLAVPADFAGVVHAGGTRTQKEYAYLDYMGVSWILHTFNWESIEPEPGEWDFLYYDALVEKANAAGIKVLGILAYDTWWIHADRNTHKYIPPEFIPDFLDYVRQTVSHYQGRVDAWCIWNEPNFVFWKGTKAEYLELARRAADVVREVDSEVTLISGAFNRGIFGLPEDYIRGLFESGAMEKVDAVAFHPYELNPRRAAKLYDRFKNIVDDYGFGDKIWVTEVGYPTGGWYPTRVAEKKFPAYVVKTFVSLAVRGSQKLLWYQLFDPNKRVRKDSEDFFGLIRGRRDYTSKGAEAFRLCAAYLSGAVYSPEKLLRDGVPNSLQSFYFEGSGGGALILWNDGPGSRALGLALPGTDHIRHDPVTGNSLAISAQIDIKAGSMPVFITWQGGNEAPCIIQKR
jgi:hypothetical protein